MWKNIWFIIPQTVCWRKRQQIVLFYRCFLTVVYFMADDNIGTSHNKT